MAGGGNGRRTLDVFILCRRIRIENRWNKSPRQLLASAMLNAFSTIDTSALAALQLDLPSTRKRFIILKRRLASQVVYGQ